jgi:hypothetical protein
MLFFNDCKKVILKMDKQIMEDFTRKHPSSGLRRNDVLNQARMTTEDF